MDIADGKNAVNEKRHSNSIGVAFHILWDEQLHLSSDNFPAAFAQRVINTVLQALQAFEFVQVAF